MWYRGASLLSLSFYSISGFQPSAVANGAVVAGDELVLREHLGVEQRVYSWCSPEMRGVWGPDSTVTWTEEVCEFVFCKSTHL